MLVYVERILSDSKALALQYVYVYFALQLFVIVDTV